MAETTHGDPHLHHHFANAEQQYDAATTGMWIFLITEIMFFGGLFAGYTIYRNAYPVAWGEASRRLDIVLGTVNTAVLICSSFTMALAVRCAQLGKRKEMPWYLFITIAFGLAFLAIKGVEYYQKFVEHLVPGPSFEFAAPLAQNAQLYFSFYFAMTGLHALHMVVGVGLVAALLVRNARGEFSPEYHWPVEITGLYWHFVDIVWIFLFPLLYLINRYR